MAERREDSASVGEEPLLDDAVLATIASLQRPGAPDLVLRVLELFSEDAPRHVADIVEGVDAFDIERVRTAAHTLKSSAANVGAMRLAGRCARIERAARDANPIACAALADALEALLEDTLRALRERYDPAGGSSTAGAAEPGRNAA